MVIQHLIRIQNMSDDTVLGLAAVSVTCTKYASPLAELCKTICSEKITWIYVVSVYRALK
jgi:hypothetical protein